MMMMKAKEDPEIAYGIFEIGDGGGETERSSSHGFPELLDFQDYTLSLLKLSPQTAALDLAEVPLQESLDDPKLILNFIVLQGLWSSQAEGWSWPPPIPKTDLGLREVWGSQILGGDRGGTRGSWAAARRVRVRVRVLGNGVRSSFLNVPASYLVSFLGSFPAQFSRTLVRKLLGQSWSTTAVDVVCSNLMQYHTMRNALFMAMTEFAKFSEEPDWSFMREKQNQLALLFGIGDHWAPLSFFEKVSKEVPDLALSIEREGHTHGFCCADAGSLWVADHVATLISDKLKLHLSSNTRS